MEKLAERLRRTRTEEKPPRPRTAFSEGPEPTYGEQREYQSRRRAGASYDLPRKRREARVVGYAYTLDPDGDIIDTGPAFEPSDMEKLYRR